MCWTLIPVLFQFLAFCINGKAAEKRERALRAPLPEARVAMLQTHDDFNADYPVDLIEITEEARQDYLLPTHVANVPSRITYALDETVEHAMVSAPTVVKQAALAIKDIDTNSTNMPTRCMASRICFWHRTVMCIC